MPQQMETGLQKARRLIKESERRNEIICDLLSQHSAGYVPPNGEPFCDYADRRLCLTNNVK